MAKARSLVGLDVHATKVVAAVLDAESGELAFFALGGDVTQAAGCARGCRGRWAWRMRRGRRVTAWRASWRGGVLGVWSRRRARSRARRGIA